MARARGFFERALTIDPGNLDALRGEGQVDYTVGAAYLSDDRDARLAAAEAEIAKVLALRPNDAQAHEFMGGILVETKRAEQGIAEFKRALVLDPNLAMLTGSWVSPRYSSVTPKKPEPMKTKRCVCLRETVPRGSGCTSRALRRCIWAVRRRRSHCFAAPSRSTQITR